MNSKRPRNQKLLNGHDHDKREAELLARLEAEREQRLAEKIAAGEIVSVPLFIVAGSETEARAQVEQAKADKLAELRAAGDQREVVFTVELVVTGVVRHGEAATLSRCRARLHLPHGRMRPLGRPCRRAPHATGRGRRGGGPETTAPAHRNLHLCSNPPMPG